MHFPIVGSAVSKPLANLDQEGRRIACFLPSLAGGGAERVALNLAQGLQRRGCDVDLILAQARGPYRANLPEGVRVIDLDSPRVFKSIPRLARHLRDERYDAVISHMNHANIAAILARRLAGVETLPCLLVVEHNMLSATKTKLRRERLLPWFMQRFYPAADAVVGTAEVMSRDLEQVLRFPPGSVYTIYNPVVDDLLPKRASEPLEHPWFAPDEPPVLLAIGRLTQQKNFGVLLDAFARLRDKRAVRLVILGEGEERASLETKISNLKLEGAVQMPGFVSNPYAYLKHARLFVLSSQWEGLPAVLIEALGCGCPVVSTDCPSGPREILADGAFGTLVPMMDIKALALAMETALDAPRQSSRLIERAQSFSFDASVTNYLKLIDSLAQKSLRR